MIHLDPRRVVPLGAAVAAAIATAVTTTFIFIGGGFKMVDVPRGLAALTQNQKNIVKLAKDHGVGTGILYVWGGTSHRGFDCSGFVYHVVQQDGINIPRTSYSQYADKHAIKVPKNQVRPGDVVFFVGSQGSTTNPGHVGFYLGNGQMVEYYSTGHPARQSILWRHRDYIGARRWWHPAQIQKRTYSIAVWIAHHWGIRIRGSSGGTVVFVPALGHKYFDKAKRARIVKWAHNNHHKTSGNRTYLNIKLVK